MEQYSQTRISRILPHSWKVVMHRGAITTRIQLRSAQAGDKVGILGSAVAGLAWRILEHGSGEKLPR